MPRDDDGPRCELTELYVNQCAHCRGLTGKVRRYNQNETDRWFRARYPGRCIDCDGYLAPGEYIRRYGDEGYLCEDCGMEYDRA